MSRASKPPRPKSNVKGVRCSRWSQNGGGEWVAYWVWEHDGKVHSAGIGEEGRMMAEAAKAKAIAKDYENKEIQAGLQVKRTRLKTVAELLDWYMEIQQGRIGQKKKGVKVSGSKKPITEKTYLRNVARANNLKQLLGKKHLPISAADIQDYWDAAKKAGYHVNTINSDVNSLLKAAFKLAVKRRKLPQEFFPADGFESQVETVLRRAITEEEHKALLAQCDKVGDQDFADVLHCAYETGMRSGDISRLIKKEVKFDQLRIVAGKKVVASYFDLGHDTKTGMPRAVPISPKLRPVIERRLAGLKDGDYVFTRELKGQRVRWGDSNAITRKMEIRAKQAGLLYGDNHFDKHGNRIGFTFHCYKSRMLAELVAKGANEFVIRMILGTTSPEAIKHYAHSIDPGVTYRYINGDIDSESDSYRIKTA